MTKNRRKKQAKISYRKILKTSKKQVKNKKCRKHEKKTKNRNIVKQN